MNAQQSIALVGLMLTVSSCSPQMSQQEASTDRNLSGAKLLADVAFLSDDLLEGREAGKRGYDVAANYVASRFRSLGLQPGGTNQSFFQPVPLVEPRKATPESGSLSFSGPNAKAIVLDDTNHFVFPSSRAPTVDIEAPVVFVGYGFSSEDHGRDDFKGVDVEGKIAIVLGGAPKYLNSEERAHFGATSAERLSERGAIGWIWAYTPTAENTMPFQRLLGFLRDGTRVSWLKADGTTYSRAPNIQAGAAVSVDAAGQILRAAGADWDQILEAAASESGLVEGLDTGLTARIEVDATHTKYSSPNVVGILPGTDPVLSHEHIVLVAHLDHVGTKSGVSDEEDGIFNGAMDNAVGVAVLLETARRLAQSPPRRSVIFLATTAEEKGMVGSDYYAENPTVAADSIVAVVNQDMPILTFDFQDVVAYGAERSNIYPVVEAAAERGGAELSPDPIPDEGIFTRSEQYSFAKRGVPGLSLKPGFANGGDLQNNEFRSTHYHKVTDEVGLVDVDALSRFAYIMYEISRGIADMNDRPVWRNGDFFARTFGGPMEELDKAD